MRVMSWIALVAAGWVVAVSLPDIKRYWRIRNM